MLNKIVWHWTGGAKGLNTIEADAYHFIIQWDGKVEAGLDKPEDNIPPLRQGAYAAHTLNLNSNSIGIAVDAMAGAVERPFNKGSNPITEPQVESLVHLTARLCLKYGIPLSRKTTLSHAEVEPTLKVKQRQKWDITWLPGMTKPLDPVIIGDQLRARTAEAIAKLQAKETAPEVKKPAAAKAQHWFVTWLLALFGR
jgi:hypothetical protein